MLQDLVLNKQSEIIYGMPHDYAVQYMLIFTTGLITI